MSAIRQIALTERSYVFLFIYPDLSERFAEIIVDDLLARLGQARAFAGWAALQLFLAPRFDGGDYFRDQGAFCAGFDEQSAVEKQGRIAGVLAAGALGYALDLASAVQELFHFLFQLCPDFGF